LLVMQAFIAQIVINQPKSVQKANMTDVFNLLFVEMANVTRETAISRSVTCHYFALLLACDVSLTDFVC